MNMDSEKEKKQPETAGQSGGRLEKKAGDYPVLIIDDNAETLRSLAEILREEGYDVTAAESSRRAMERFQEKYFPVVLIDRFMPEMDGLELCRAIRETESPGYVFVILMTARNSQAGTVAGISAGADDYLAKPIESTELKARIETGLRILELERSLREANDEVRKLTVIDPLTGCFSLGYGIGRLAEDMRRTERYGHPLSLVLCGIDDLKAIKELHGQSASESIMRAFVNCIQGSIRNKVDWLCRYGREDFLLVLPETGLEGAKTMAERLREEVSRIAVEFENQAVEITACFGVAGFEGDPKIGEVSPDKLIAEADRLLRLAKRCGKNRTEAKSVRLSL